MDLYGKICDILDSISCKVCIVTTAVMIIVTLANIATRVMLGASIACSAELARYMFVWSTLLGGSIAVHRSQLAATTIFVDKLSDKSKKVLNILAELVILVFSAYCAFYGSTLCLAVRNQASAALLISMSYIYIAVPISFTLIAIYTIYKLGLLFGISKHKESGGEVA